MFLAEATTYFDYFNPFKYVPADQYVSFWRALFATIFEGVFARIFAVSFLVLAFWTGVYRQRIGSGATFFVLSLVVTYFGGVLRVFFRF